MWIARSFFDLSNKRPYLGAGFGAAPQPIDTMRIREHFHLELGLKGAASYRTFRTLIDAMDGDWLTDWRERDEARREEEERERDLQARRR